MATPTITPAKRSLVLVTGGSGYIAGYCIAQLLNEGWRVRAGLNSDAGWANAIAGADYVLHVASPVPTVDPKTDDELVRPARDGTLRVLKAARDAGVTRVVMTSSISAAGRNIIAPPAFRGRIRLEPTTNFARIQEKHEEGA